MTDVSGASLEVAPPHSPTLEQVSTPIQLSGTPRTLLAAAVWTLLLLGLFVMHGASSHGTAAHTAAPDATVLEVAASHDGHAGHDAVAQSDDPAAGSEDNGGSQGHSAAELCLAILCALLSALAAFGFLTRPRRLLFTAPRSAVSAPFPSWLRPPDPPCLIRLSILRC